MVENTIHAAEKRRKIFQPLSRTTVKVLTGHHEWKKLRFFKNFIPEWKFGPRRIEWAPSSLWLNLKLGLFEMRREGKGGFRKQSLYGKHVSSRKTFWKKIVHTQQDWRGNSTTFGELTKTSKSSIFSVVNPSVNFDRKFEVEGHSKNENWGS